METTALFMISWLAMVAIMLTALVVMAKAFHYLITTRRRVRTRIRQLKYRSQL